jgi:hypothetical protein
MRLSITLDLWTLLIGFSVMVTAIASIVIAGRLARILVLLGQLQATLNLIRMNLSGIATVIRSQEEAINAAREAEETNAERLYLGEECSS